MITFAPTDAGMVVVYPRGQLTVDDKTALAGVGIVAVEADDPAAVNILPQPMPAVQPVQYDDMLMSALYGVSKSSTAQIAFNEELHRRLKNRESQKAATP